MALRVAVVGAGYWGPNLVRNFRGSPDWDLVAVCDLDQARAEWVIGDRTTVHVETSLDALLARVDIDAVGVMRELDPARFEVGKAVINVPSVEIGPAGHSRGIEHRVAGGRREEEHLLPRRFDARADGLREQLGKPRAGGKNEAVGSNRLSVR